MSESPDTTRCRCGNVWVPMGWQERTRNVTCPRCGGWNQAGVTDLRHRPVGSRAVEAAVLRGLRRAFGVLV